MIEFIMIKQGHLNKTQRILVVEDQQIHRDALNHILKDSYEVEFAFDGMEAWEKVSEEPKRYSLIMMDIFTPGMSGFDLLKKFKSTVSTRAIPVIVLTADKSAELKALQLGAADFITKPFDVHEVILARVARIIELSERQQLISTAERDDLTGLYSGPFFYEYAERMRSYHKKKHYDAVEINIEQFHSINALSGRAFGDRVLAVLGEEISLFLSDKEGIASRIGADRFVIYVEHMDSYDELLAHLQARLNELSSSVNVHLRMGVKPYQEDADPILMFDHAHSASSLARGDYVRPIRIYDEEMRDKELLNQRLLNDVRVAVSERQFQVYYQPKYNIQCDPPKLCAAEALIRWIHPELGFVSPSVFIPLFESNGVITRIDHFVWVEAANQIKRWKEKYGFSIPISVNLSRTDVFDATLIDRLCKLIKDHGLNYRDISLEVTESAYTENAKTLLEVVAKLREIGFEIEMDDFGSGYSSLNVISSMPIDVLKMDRNFVRGLEHSEIDRHLVKLIVDLARFLHLKVVAEGVETEGQMQFLKDAGCDIVQGFYFSKALPVDEFEQLLEKQLSLTKKD